MGRLRDWVGRRAPGEGRPRVNVLRQKEHLSEGWRRWEWLKGRG